MEREKRVFFFVLTDKPGENGSWIELSWNGVDEEDDPVGFVLFLR